MYRFSVFLAAFCCCVCSVFGADRPTLLITPQGVWQVDYVNDVPQAPRPVDFDVVVRGFKVGDVPNIPDVPPVQDSPAVQAVASISKTVLKDASEATAVYAVVEALKGSGLTGKEFGERLTDFAGLIDAQISAGGRVTKWVDQVVAAVKTADGSVNAQDVLDGLKRAFPLNKAVTDMVVSEAAAPPGTEISEQAVDFVKLIELIRLILDLIKSFKGQ